MNIEQRITILEQEIEELRARWKSGSMAMRIHIEQQAKNKQAQIKVFQSVLKRRARKEKLQESFFETTK